MNTLLPNYVFNGIERSIQDLLVDNIIQSHAKVKNQIIYMNKSNIDISILDHLKLTNSLILDDLDNITIRIDKKINHLIIRKCRNICIYLAGAVSGIDLINSTKNNIFLYRSLSSIIDISESSDNNIYIYKTKPDNSIIRSYFSILNKICTYDKNGIKIKYNHQINYFNPNYRLIIGLEDIILY